MIHLTAEALRVISDYLDQLGTIEARDGIESIGHLGYAEITVTDGDVGRRDAVLRIERANLPTGGNLDGLGAGPIAYVLVVEVP